MAAARVEMVLELSPRGWEARDRKRKTCTREGTECVKRQDLLKGVVQLENSGEFRGLENGHTGGGPGRRGCGQVGAAVKRTLFIQKATGSHQVVSYLAHV